jgi:hypothetical protein
VIVSHPRTLIRRVALASDAQDVTQRFDPY